MSDGPVHDYNRVTGLHEMHSGHECGWTCAAHWKARNEQINPPLPKSDPYKPWQPIDYGSGGGTNTGSTSGAENAGCGLVIILFLLLPSIFTFSLAGLVLLWERGMIWGRILARIVYYQKLPAAEPYSVYLWASAALVFLLGAFVIVSDIKKGKEISWGQRCSHWLMTISLTSVLVLWATLARAEWANVYFGLVVLFMLCTMGISEAISAKSKRSFVFFCFIALTVLTFGVMPLVAGYKTENRQLHAPAAPAYHPAPPVHLTPRHHRRH
jgi:hypothetical protein